MVAALRDLGLRKAGTPLLIASTPVSAAHPEENDLATRNTRATPTTSPWVEWILNAADSACSGWPSTKIWTNPQPSMAKTPIMNAYVGTANAVPDSRMPRRLAAATTTTVPTANATL
nr:hypothetical protein CPGR_01121 [Mycolicibacter nonchromogenicus]